MTGAGNVLERSSQLLYLLGRSLYETRTKFLVNFVYKSWAIRSELRKWPGTVDQCHLLLYRGGCMKANREA